MMLPWSPTRDVGGELLWLSARANMVSASVYSSRHFVPVYWLHYRLQVSRSYALTTVRKMSITHTVLLQFKADAKPEEVKGVRNTSYMKRRTCTDSVTRWSIRLAPGF